MPTGDTALVANLARVYTVNLLGTLDGAGILTGAGNYNEGQSVTVSATANPGYRLTTGVYRTERSCLAGNLFISGSR